MLGTHHIFVDASRVTGSCRFTDVLLFTAVFFRPFSCAIAVSRHSPFFYRAINIPLLKLVSTPTWPYTSNSHPSPPPPPPLMEMVGRGGRRVKGRQGHKETGVKETGDRETDRKTGDRQGTDRETGGGNKKDPPTTEMLVITDIFSSCRPTTSHF